MRNLFLLMMLLCPLLVFPSNEVVPEGYKLIWLVLAILALVLVIPAFRKLKKGGSSFHLPFTGRRLKADLLQDRRYRPKTLTLVVKNISRKDIDIEAPVIMFRKLLSIRKFKLKGIDRHEIYPLYLEAGKMHELHINLSIFHGYDRALRKFYWARILLCDTSGRKYSTRYVTLRKSLFS